MKDYVLLDDIDRNTKADETVTFGLDGVNYQIDLSSDNATKLREALAPWAKAAHRVGGRRSYGRRAHVSTGPSANDIRVWANENGYSVSSRGRVSEEVREAYDKAHA